MKIGTVASLPREHKLLHYQQEQPSQCKLELLLKRQYSQNNKNLILMDSTKTPYIFEWTVKMLEVLLKMSTIITLPLIFVYNFVKWEYYQELFDLRFTSDNPFASIHTEALPRYKFMYLWYKLRTSLYNPLFESLLINLFIVNACPLLSLAYK